MAGTNSSQPNQPNQPKRPNPPRVSGGSDRKPLQVMHISRKEEKDQIEKNSPSPSENQQTSESLLEPPFEKTKEVSIANDSGSKISDESSTQAINSSHEMTMEDVIGSSRYKEPFPEFEKNNSQEQRSVDDFDFDEDEFLAALNENEPIGNTGEIAKGKVIEIESDGIYVDIGGKAPGFMPKNECGLGVITNLKEKFPKGLHLEVLVTREQNAEGIVTISCRALELRKSWEKVIEMEKESKVIKVKITGYNRGGVTCDVEGLRGFIPRSQLEDGANHESLVGKVLGVAFLEVNSLNRKLVLSEKRAATVSRFSELKIGQLVLGKITAIKPYGFFVDLVGVSGLLHHSMITNGSIRSLREIFKTGEEIKALITELDPKRGRISLNTALLEGPPGEILVEKEKVMNEAEERAKKAQSILSKKED
tara:strand:+ start:1792 stop:3057 length:1266 start_codon:yes stop_codon:yes gene_type:complete